MVPVEEGQEVWENPNAGPRYIKQYNQEGKLVSVPIRPGKRFVLTTKERLINSDIAASEELDMFKNGQLVPVTLAETAQDYEKIMSNPNLISETDMAALFKIKKVADFRERLATITNKTVLERIQALADDDETNASVPQVKAIMNRLEEINPTPDRPRLTEDDLNNNDGLFKSHKVS